MQANKATLSPEAVREFWNSQHPAYRTALASAAACLLVLVGASFLTGWLGDAKPLICSLVDFFVGMSITALGFLNAQRYPKISKATQLSNPWVWFAICGALYGFSALGLGIFETRQLSTESWRDPAMALQGIAQAALTFCLFLKARRGKFADNLRGLIDSAIIAVGVSTTGWYLWLADSWKIGQYGGFYSFVIGTFLLQILSFAFFAFSGLYNRTVSTRSHRFLAGTLLGAGFLMFAAVLEARSSWAQAQPFGIWSEFINTVGWLVMALSGFNFYLNRNAERTTLFQNQNRLFLKRWESFALYGPYVAVTMAIVETGAYDWMHNKAVRPTQFGEIGLLLALIIFRQLVVLRENRRLATKLDIANENLTELVDHLKSLKDLTSVINESLDPERVLEESAEYIGRILRADAVLVTRELEGSVEVLKVMGDAYHPTCESLVRQSRKIDSLPIQLTECDSNENQYFAIAAGMLWRHELAGRIVAVRHTRRFEVQEVHMLNGIADEVSKALRNATQHASALEAADRDPVTGILNHRAFHQRLQDLIENFPNSGVPIAVSMVDLNNFKLFNDTYGHLSGDAVLKTVAEGIQRFLPVGGFCARYGGDEFAVAIPGFDEDALAEMAEDIRNSLALAGFEANGVKVPIGLSFGIASFPADGPSRHDLLNVADRNLYDVKTSGGGIRRTTQQERENRDLRALANFETLDALVSAVDNKDRYTRKHSEDVTEYALWIAEEIGMSEDAMRSVRRAGLLHDVGKIGVPDSILRKPGRLTAEEFEIIQRHPRLGELIVSAIPGMEDVVEGVRSHHERWDGHGYPDQLVGTEIPLMGRLLAVADAYSAMTTDRPYRQGMPSREAIKRITDGIGTQFDPELGHAFLRAVKKHDPSAFEDETPPMAA